MRAQRLTLKDSEDGIGIAHVDDEEHAQNLAHARAPIGYAVGRMALAGSRHPRRRTIFYPLLLLGSAASVLFFGFFLIDWSLSHSHEGPIKTLLHFDADTLENALGNLSQVLAAVLGIVITVVSIVVQLAATRYTPRLAEMFFRDKTNLGVLGFFVVACINAVWVSISVGKDFMPKVSVVATLCLVTVSLLMLVPYFAYVFDFLDPDRVVSRIQKDAVLSAVNNDPLTIVERQLKTTSGIEQLADISINAVSQKDKAMAVGAIDAIKDLGITYLEQKKNIAPAWFGISPPLKDNTDFVALAAESIEEISEKKTWLEWKVLRQFQLIYNEALGEMPDINHLISINTRYLGQAALYADDAEALNLAVKFFNTYMRSTLNTSRVRTAYNVLNQYRQLAEAALANGRHQLTGEIAFYLRYYGQIAHGKDLGFVTETVAYDLATLCERALIAQGPSHDVVLKHLLELDKPADTAAQETMLRGVRKAQSKLATFYLVSGHPEHARRIYADMKEEKAERLRSIRDELLAIEAKDFWEVIDRGTNFDYLDAARKTQLKVFFGWFENLKEAVAS
jgi:hypothetical protein